MDFEALKARKTELKAQIKAAQNAGKPDSEIEPIFKEYQEVSARVKEAQSDAGVSENFSSPEKQARSMPTTIDDLKAEKSELKAKLKTADANDPQTAVMFERYNAVKAAIEAGDPSLAGDSAAAAAPAATAAPAASSSSGGGDVITLDELNAEKSDLKAKIKVADANDPGTAAMYERYTEVKDLIANYDPNNPPKRGGSSSAAAAPAISDEEREKLSRDLWTAARANEIDTINDLLSKGADLETRGKHGATPLMIAAHCGHTDAVSALLDAGASHASRSDQGATALFIAAQNKHLGVVKLLIERGADIEAAKDNGITALWIAAYCGNDDVINYLLEQGANKEATKTDFGISALSIAAEKRRYDAVRSLCSAGCDVNAADTQGFTALHTAVTNEDMQMVELLLDNGADIDAIQDEGLSAVEIAAQLNMREIVKLLIRRGCHVSESSGVYAMPPKDE